MLDDQQPEQLACATSIPVKERSKKCRNWSKDETSILLNCKKEGRFTKETRSISIEVYPSQCLNIT